MAKEKNKLLFNYFFNSPKLRLSNYVQIGDRCIAHSTYEIAESFIEVKWEWIVVRKLSLNMDFYVSLN